MTTPIAIPRRGSFLTALLAVALIAGVDPVPVHARTDGAEPLLTREFAEAAMERQQAARRSASTKQALILPFYDLEDGRSATLIVLNRFRDPIQFEVTAFDMTGARAPLGSFIVEPTSHLPLVLERLVPPAEERFRHGSLHVDYLGDAKMLQAWLIGNRDGDVLEYPLANREEHANAAVISFWDLRRWPREGVEPAYYLHNADTSPVAATVTIHGGGEPAVSLELALDVAQTVIVRPAAVSGAGHGWIRVVHDGNPGALQALGILEGAHSSLLPMKQSHELDERSFETVPLAVVGNSPGPVPFVVSLLNVDPIGQPRAVTVSMLSAATGVTVGHAVRTVGPGAIEVIDVASLAMVAPVPIRGRVRFRLHASGPGLIPWGAQFTASGHPVEIPFAPGHHAHGEGIYPIPSLAGRRVNTTFVNLAPQFSEILLQFTSKKGSYAFEPILLAPGESYDLDLAVAAQAPKADRLGRTLDSTYEAGFLQWTSRGGRRLIARTTVTPAGGDDSFGFNCNQCCGQMPIGELIPGTATFPSGTSAPFEACVEYTTCTGTIGPFPASSPVLTYSAPFSWNAVNVSASGPARQILGFTSSETGQREGGICLERNFNIGDEGPVVAARVRITGADFLADRITVSLEPTDGILSGNFTLVLKHTTNGSSRLLFSGSRNSGTYTFTFGNLNGYTNGHVYNQVEGQWSPNGVSVKGTFPINLSVLGDYTNTCYNTPLESEYGPPLVRVGTTAGPAACAWGWNDFYNGYMQAINLNGSGRDRMGRTMLPEGICSGAPFESPPYCSAVLGTTVCRWWRVPAPIRTSCNTVPTPSLTVARSLSDNKLSCGKSIYITGFGVRTVQDTGSFAANKLDHYGGFGNAACAGWANTSAKVFGLSP